MRVAAADFGALPLVEARLALGGLVLPPFLWRARAQFTAVLWLRIAGIAAINSVVPFALFAWGAERAPAGIGAITNAMTVMFTTLVAWLLFGERISVRRIVGLTAGFVGVAILASGKTAGADVTLAALAGTAAAVCYGFGINLVRRYLTGLPSAGGGRGEPAHAARCCSRRSRSTPGRRGRSRGLPGRVPCCWACCAPGRPSSSITA